MAVQWSNKTHTVINLSRAKHKYICPFVANVNHFFIFLYDLKSVISFGLKPYLFGTNLQTQYYFLDCYNLQSYYVLVDLHCKLKKVVIMNYTFTLAFC